MVAQVLQSMQTPGPSNGKLGLAGQTVCNMGDSKSTVHDAVWMLRNAKMARQLRHFQVIPTSIAISQRSIEKSLLLSSYYSVSCT